MQVLQQEWKARLAAVALCGIAHGARRRRLKEGAVIGFALVIASGAKTAGDPQDQESRRKIPPGTDQRQADVCAIRRDAGRIERREIRFYKIVRVLQSRPGRVNCETAENDDDEERLNPPVVLSQSAKLIQGQCFVCHVDLSFSYEFCLFQFQLIWMGVLCQVTNNSA